MKRVGCGREWRGREAGGKLSIGGINNSAVGDAKDSLGLGKARGIVYLADALLSESFAERKTGRGGVGDDMSTDGFAGFVGERGGSGIGHHLAIGQRRKEESLLVESSDETGRTSENHVKISRPLSEPRHRGMRYVLGD